MISAEFVVILLHGPRAILMSGQSERRNMIHFIKILEGKALKVQFYYRHKLLHDSYK